MSAHERVDRTEAVRTCIQPPMEVDNRSNPGRVWQLTLILVTSLCADQSERALPQGRTGAVSY